MESGRLKRAIEKLVKADVILAAPSRPTAP